MKCKGKKETTKVESMKAERERKDKEEREDREFLLAGRTERCDN